MLPTAIACRGASIMLPGMPARGMRGPEITTEEPVKAVEEWFDVFGNYVASESYEPAREMIAEDVVAFGTKAELVEGVDYLVEQQWKGIWPNIEAFTFEDVRAKETGDGAWAAATWTSTGFDEDGNSYHRPGRATITFEHRDGQWLAVHTHFSLYPDTPRPTHGPEGRTD